MANDLFSYRLLLRPESLQRYAGHEEAKWLTNEQQPPVQAAAANDEQVVGDVVLEVAAEVQPEVVVAYSYASEGSAAPAHHDQTLGPNSRSHRKHEGGSACQLALPTTSDGG